MPNTKILTINDAADAPVHGLVVYGKSEQKTYNGYNLLDPRVMDQSSNYYTKDSNGNYIFNVGNSEGTSIYTQGVVFNVYWYNGGWKLQDDCCYIQPGIYYLSFSIRYTSISSNISRFWFNYFSISIADAKDNQISSNTGVLLSGYPNSVSSSWTKHVYKVELTNGGYLSITSQGATTRTDTELSSIKLEIKDLMISCVNCDYEPYVGCVYAPSPDHPQQINHSNITEISSTCINLYNVNDWGNWRDGEINCAVGSGTYSPDGLITLTASGVDCRMEGINYSIGSYYTTKMGPLIKLISKTFVVKLFNAKNVGSMLVSGFDKNFKGCKTSVTGDDYGYMGIWDGVPVTVSDDVEYVVLRVGNPRSKAGQVIQFKVMVVDGATVPSKYIKYSKTHIPLQYTLLSSPVDYKPSGKNLLNFSKTITNLYGLSFYWWRDRGGCYLLSGTVTNDVADFRINDSTVDNTTELFDFINNSAGTTFSLSNNLNKICYFSYRKANSNTDYYVRTSLTITNNIECTGMFIRFYKGDTFEKDTRFEIQLEMNVEPTGYEWYYPPAYIKSIFGNSGRLYAHDYIDINQGKLYKICNKVHIPQFTGRQHILPFGYLYTYSTTSTSNADNKPIQHQRYMGVCSHFNADGDLMYDNHIRFDNETIYVRCDRCNSLDEFNSLISNGIDVVYVSKDIQTIDITQEEINYFNAMKTCADGTVIWSEYQGSEPIISIDYQTDKKNHIDQVFNELKSAIP